MSNDWKILYRYYPALALWHSYFRTHRPGPSKCQNPINYSNQEGSFHILICKLYKFNFLERECFPILIPSYTTNSPYNRGKWKGRETNQQGIGVFPSYNNSFFSWFAFDAGISKTLYIGGLPPQRKCFLVA